MKITKRQLRRIIREAIGDDFFSDREANPHDGSMYGEPEGGYHTPPVVTQDLLDRIDAIERSDRQDHLWDIVDAIESGEPDWTLGMLRHNLEDADWEDLDDIVKMYEKDE